MCRPAGLELARSVPPFRPKSGSHAHPVSARGIQGAQVDVEEDPRRNVEPASELADMFGAAATHAGAPVHGSAEGAIASTYDPRISGFLDRAPRPPPTPCFISLKMVRRF